MDRRHCLPSKALRQQDKSAPVVADTDWSARNVRFDEKDLLAVYDWDSVALVRERQHSARRP